jgi:hypothetical protein
LKPFCKKFCEYAILRATATVIKIPQFAVTLSGDGKRNERSPADAFLEALDSLSRTRIDLLEKGIEKAKHRLTLIMNQASGCFIF